MLVWHIVYKVSKPANYHHVINVCLSESEQVAQKVWVRWLECRQAGMNDGSVESNCSFRFSWLQKSMKQIFGAGIPFPENTFHYTLELPWLYAIYFLDDSDKHDTNNA